MFKVKRVAFFVAGSRIDMYRCGTSRIPWSSAGSWGNNQTRGTVAWFREAPSDNHLYDWYPIHDVINC